MKLPKYTIAINPKEHEQPIVIEVDDDGNISSNVDLQALEWQHSLDEGWNTAKCKMIFIPKKE